MSSFHGKQSARTILRLFAALFISSFLVIQACAPAFAAVTTGILSGTVTDAISHVPLANVKVAANAPTGHYTATTNASGFYSINGVYGDTYTVSFDLAGYEPVQVVGQTIFPDLTTVVNETLVKSLKTIARVTSRSSGNAFQPNQTVDTYSVTPHQIQTILGNTLNLSESTLITSLPGGSLDSSGYPVIRGGRENEENFEFEGIPTTDAFTNQFTNSQSLPGLGLQSAQLTPGVGNASQDNYGSGTFNLIAKRGQYPGFATGQFAIGAPAFQHLANAEWGFASPNGKISAYLTLADTNQARTYNSAGYTNCNAIGTCFSRLYQDSREGLANIVFKFGNNNNQQLQLFYDSEEYRFFTQQFNANALCFKSCDPLYLFDTGARAFGAANVSPAAGLTCVSALNCPGYTTGPICPTPPASCATLQAQYANIQLLQGLMDLQSDSGQTQLNQTLGAVGARPQTTFQPDHLIKLGYAWNVSPTTFLEAMVYHQDSVVRFNNALSGGYSTSGSARESLQGGKATGAKIDITKQMGDRHLLKTGIRYALLIPVFKTSPSGSGLRDLILSGNNEKTGIGGELSDFIPQASCPLVPATRCGYIYGNNYVVNGVGGQAAPFTGAQKVTHAFENTSVVRQDYSAYIDDTWTPNDRMKVEAGLRLDEANYQYPTPVMDLNTCTSQYLPNYSFDSNGNMLTTPATLIPGMPSPQVFYTNPKTGLSQSTGAGNCGVATFNLTKQMKNPIIPEPIISATYRLGANDSVRASWGRSLEYEILADADNSASGGFFGGPGGAFNSLPAYASPATSPNGLNCGIFNDVTCVNYAEQLYWANASNFAGTPIYNPTRPTVFTNADFSWEHQFTRGFLRGVQFKVTPWWRKAQDEIALVQTPKIFNGQILTDPNTFAVIFNPATANNLGNNQATGVEAQFTKEQPYGLSGQVTLNYQNETSSVIPLTGNEDFFPAIPTPSVLLGNSYRVGFLSPFSTTFDLSYQTQSGWRINPQIQWNMGYPISPGLVSSGFINGQPYNVPNTNASLALVASAGGTNQYVDPMNPGSFFAPNVAATRGIPATSSPGGKLSTPSSTTNLTIEYNAPKTWTAGMQIFNLFGVLHGGPSLNGRWQQLATGISGPLTGQLASALLFPQYGMSGDFGALRYGRNAYIDTPNGIRRYYFYLQVKL